MTYILIMNGIQHEAPVGGLQKGFFLWFSLEILHKECEWSSPSEDSTSWAGSRCVLVSSFFIADPLSRQQTRKRWNQKQVVVGTTVMKFKFSQQRVLTGRRPARQRGKGEWKKIHVILNGVNARDETRCCGIYATVLNTPKQVQSSTP